MKLKSSVKVQNHFPQLRRRIHEGAIPAALAAAARDGAAAASKRADKRKDTGKMSDIKRIPPLRDKKGWHVSFYSPPFYAVYQEYGTLKGRRRKLSKATISRRSSPSGQARQAKVAGQAGIKPLNFMAAGRRVARGSLLAYLAREIRRIP